MVRYWSAIAIARCHGNLELSVAEKVISLLEQAMDEVGLPTVLLMAKDTGSVGVFQSKLEGMGQLVVRHDDGESGLRALSRYPSKDIVVMEPSFSSSMAGQEFVDQLRAQPQGSDVPLVILSEGESADEYRVAYQGQAQEMVLFGDSVDILGQKFSKVKAEAQQVVGRDLAAELSSEALKALDGLGGAVLVNYPSLVGHLSDLLVSPYQPEVSKKMAVRVLGKMGMVAAGSVDVLLDLLEREAGVQYKLAILDALLSVSDGSERVRDRLYRIMVDPQNPDSFRRVAATYLSLHQEHLSAEERRGFKRSFFTSSIGAKRGS
jgi:CheY-like chemotaxis protein